MLCLLFDRKSFGQNDFYLVLEHLVSILLRISPSRLAATEVGCSNMDYDAVVRLCLTL